MWKIVSWIKGNVPTRPGEEDKNLDTNTKGLGEEDMTFN